MTNEVATQSMALSEPELLSVMESSLYPGASPASIKMVLGYCKAAHLDPMLKPVHIVPMWDKKAKRMRDVIMPGIGSYRVQAARSGCMGISEPEFGPDVEATLGGAPITYPRWCRVTVKRAVAGGQVAEFTARELWLENYATAGRDTVAPNAMWHKRPYGQLAKCAEAQALRKGFPEIGAAPTADEMAGKEIEDAIDAQPVHARPAEIVKPAALPYDDKRFDANFQKWAATIQSGKHNAAFVIDFAAQRGSPFTEEQKARLLSVKAPSAEPEVIENETGMTYAAVADALQRAGDTDALDAAADLIGSVSDPKQRHELSAMYEERKSAIEGVEA